MGNARIRGVTVRFIYEKFEGRPRIPVGPGSVGLTVNGQARRRSTVATGQGNRLSGAATNKMRLPIGNVPF